MRQNPHWLGRGLVELVQPGLSDGPAVLVAWHRECWRKCHQAYHMRHRFWPQSDLRLLHPRRLDSRVFIVHVWHNSLREGHLVMCGRSRFPSGTFRVPGPTCTMYPSYVDELRGPALHTCPQLLPASDRRQKMRLWPCVLVHAVNFLCLVAGLTAALM